MKFFFLVLLLLGGLAELANSEAALPAYVIGLVAATLFVEKREIMQRIRGVAFALLTPFFFLKAGTLVSLPALWAGILLIVALLVVKIATKFVGIWPLTRAFRMTPREGNYTTLLMSTGLTFGSISALFGLTHGIISQAQYTILVTVVIGSAIVPTFIAQTWFLPGKQRVTAHEAVAAEDEELAAGEVSAGVSAPRGR
jgi:Kef-type K+ transport system membrane component KefB